MAKDRCGKVHEELVEKSPTGKLAHVCILPQHTGDHRCYCWYHWRNEK